MSEDLTRRDFIKTTSMAALSMAIPADVFAADNLSVKTRYGTFNGFVDKNGVKTWLGIPFAQSPVGKLRWQDPQPLKPSNKSFDAKQFGFKPVQNYDDEGASKIPESEDCLKLNIWKRGDGKNLPVMVFIHGGAFAFESASDPLYHGGNFAAANDVVLVSLEYRMNVFGFMNLAAIDSAFEDCGCLGLKDQIAGLQWVKENISAFGGNPDNITIFGESAGSISVMLLTIASAAKGLFDKAIPQSGHVDFYNKPENSAQLAEQFLSTSGAKNLGELVKKSTDEIKAIYLQLSEVRGFSLADYLPTCDGKFLPADPFKALKDGAARGIKFLTGTTADEWRCFLLVDENLFKLFRAEPQKNSPIFSQYKKRSNEEIYKSWLKNRSDTDDTYGDFATQIDWRVGQELSAEYQSKFDDVYFYLFSELSPIELVRSCHGVDLPFTLNNPDTLHPNPAQNLVKQVQATWTAFAATGNPNNEFIPTWEKYSADNRQTMELNSKGCVCHKDFNTENLNALRYVYED
ncbi:MAG: carboxylesterase/lipase family protein [Selenomonadaceae bacterium]|nr:carboxylesterase/lipase family protein [Selenomonadaceae bacterium]